MDPSREVESWGAWVRRQREDPESAAQGMVREGVAFDTALLILMLGKIHEELIEMVDGPPEEWRGEPS